MSVAATPHSGRRRPGLWGFLLLSAALHAAAAGGLLWLASWEAVHTPALTAGAAALMDVDLVAGPPEGEVEGEAEEAPGLEHAGEKAAGERIRPHRPARAADRSRLGGGGTPRAAGTHQGRREAALPLEEARTAALREEVTPRPPAETPRAATGVGMVATGASSSQRTGTSPARGGGGAEGAETASPLYAYNPKPPYPVSARKRGHEGTVVLRVEVLETGSVGRVFVARSSGHAELDASALRTVKRWRFSPARRGSEVVRSWVTVPVEFRLRER